MEEVGGGVARTAPFDVVMSCGRAHNQYEADLFFGDLLIARETRPAFVVDSVRPEFSKVRTRVGGVSKDVGDGNLPMGQIARRPWGERSFYMHDPFGNPLCFVDEKTTFTASPK